MYVGLHYNIKRRICSIIGLDVASGFNYFPAVGTWLFSVFSSNLFIVIVLISSHLCYLDMNSSCHTRLPAKFHHFNVEFSKFKRKFCSNWFFFLAFLAWRTLFKLLAFRSTTIFKSLNPTSIDIRLLEFCSVFIFSSAMFSPFRSLLVTPLQLSSFIALLERGQLKKRVVTISYNYTFNIHGIATQTFIFFPIEARWFITR